MNIDLNALMKATQDEIDANKGEERSLYPIVYPGENGKITFRILYNLKTNTLQRRVLRHEKQACLSMYGEDCPVCAAIKDVEAVKGKECGAFRKYGYKVRGFCIAKIVDADANYLKRVKVGDTVILMYPKTVYEEINKIIVDSGPNLDKIVSHNSGIPFVLDTATNAGGFPQYKLTLFPYGAQDLFTEPNGEQLFDELLGSLASLNDVVLPGFPDDDLRTKNRALAETIKQEYLNSNVINPSDGFVPVPEGSEQIPFDQPQQTAPQSVNPVFNAMPQPQVSQQTGTPVMPTGTSVMPQSAPQQTVTVAAPQPTAQTVQSNMPQCFGKHDDASNQCLICPYEADCFIASQSK